MKTKTLLWCVAATLVFGEGPPAFAHHSTAGYDLIHGTIIYGTIARFEWENPHAQIALEVEGENGATEHWTVELESANMLHRLGWTKQTLEEGAQITVTGGRAKDSTFRIRAVSIQLPDGRKMRALALPEN